MTSPADPKSLRRGTSAAVIARNIRNDIEAGRLSHQQQLPPTRVLADEWETSVATIHRAMEMLADEGLVISRDRSSRVVNYPAERRGGPSKPSVVMIGGYAGSGKTELGRILAKNTGWAILDKDTTTRAVVEVALELLGHSPHDRESEVYRSVIRPAEYEALISALIENVECGNSAIVTAPFVRELHDVAWCERIMASLAAAGADLHVIWVRCDAPTMRTYIKHRGAARDAWKLANWDEYISSVDMEYRPVITHSVVNNSSESRPLQRQAADLLEVVRR